MRRNAAGELMIGHVRDQLADTERVRPRIADLRRYPQGKRPLASTQARLLYVLPTGNSAESTFHRHGIMARREPVGEKRTRARQAIACLRDGL